VRSIISPSSSLICCFLSQLTFSRVFCGLLMRFLLFKKFWCSRVFLFSARVSSRRVLFFEIFEILDSFASSVRRASVIDLFTGLHRTRQAAVYLGTHYNIGSKSVTHPHTRRVTQLFTYLLTSRRTAFHAHIVFLLLRHNTAKRRRRPLPKFVFFVLL